MAHHQLIGDLAAPFLLIGLQPLLLFFLPRPVLVLLARQGWLRRAFRRCAARSLRCRVYILTIYAWHSGRCSRAR